MHGTLIGKRVVDFLFVLNANWTFLLGVTAEAPWKNIDRKSAFLTKFLGRRGRLPATFVHRYIGQWMPYNFVVEGFHIKKLCSRLSSRRVHFLRDKDHFAFLSPPLVGLQATYVVHLRLTGKPIVHHNWTFFSPSVTADTRRHELIQIENRCFWSHRVSFAQNFQVEGVDPTNHSSCQKTRWMDLLYGIKILAEVFFSFYHNSRVWQTDGQTDISLMAKTALHTCSAVKKSATQWRDGGVRIRLARERRSPTQLARRHNSERPSTCNKNIIK